MTQYIDTQAFGKLQATPIKYPHFCPYCRRMVRDHAFYYPGQPRLFFDRQSCAEKWIKTLSDENGFPTWAGVEPENETVKKVVEKLGWLKRLFKRGNSSEISE